MRSRSVSIGCQKPSRRKGCQLLVGRQPLHRTGFPDRVVAFDKVDDGRMQHEEAAIDALAVALRLFDEGGHDIVLDIRRAEAARGRHRTHRRLLAVAAVEGDLRR